MKKCYAILYLSLVFLALATLFFGETPWSVAWEGAQNKIMGHSNKWTPLLDERLPRLIVLLCTGASLAVAGAVLQALFHNPLASPSVLGISCGGSLMVIVAFLMEWHLDYPYAIPLAAFSGSLITLLLIYVLARQQNGTSISNIILTGIALSTLLIAIQSTIIYTLRDQWHLIQTIAEWEAGSTLDRNWQHVHMQLPLTLIGLIGCWRYRREIDILALGEEEARNLGVAVEKVRWRLFLCISLLIGGALAAVGVIAFFGLVLPHVLRKIVGSKNQILIPLSLLAGGASLLAMDLGLRFFEIHTLTIGNVSAVLGGIFFLLLLGMNRKQQWGNT